MLKDKRNSTGRKLWTRQVLDLQRKNAARSGGSGGSGGSTKQAAADPYIAYNDIFNSANPYTYVQRRKESQYASVLSVRWKH